MTQRLSEAEILALPPTMNIVTAARAFGRGQDWAYQMIREGAFPVPIHRLGAHGTSKGRMTVYKSDLLTALKMDGPGRASAS